MKICQDCKHCYTKFPRIASLCRSPRLISLLHGELLQELCVDVRSNTSNRFATTLCGMDGDWFEQREDEK